MLKETSVQPIALMCIGAALVVIMCPVVVQACVYIENEVTMPPSFTVLVGYRGQPFSGLKVVVGRLEKWGKEPPLQRSQTDSRGAVVVSKLAPGKYRVAVGEGSRFYETVVVIVKEGSVPEEMGTLKLKWISDHILRAQRFAGTLREEVFDTKDEQFKAGRILAGYPIVLRNPRTGRQLARIVSGPDGAFEVGQLAPGFYEVEIGQGSLALEISKDEDLPRGDIELAIMYTTCGLMFDTGLKRISSNSFKLSLDATHAKARGLPQNPDLRLGACCHPLGVRVRLSRQAGGWEHRVHETKRQHHASNIISVL
ncbi:MAG: hypothetical protein M1453_07615 [Acidobacteria bacterium]|nr:hypothetical protein [Acidobacteriota bacterium]MCL5287842.1 hypothetical protein [Acidobacteriota bacterium]